MWVHWAPRDRNAYLRADAWETEALSASRGTMQWMFCVPLQLDGANGPDLIAGAKGDNAKIGWFESPANPRRLADWQWHPIRDAGWIMSLIAEDMDGDGDKDILFSDRRGAKRGVYWLENPGTSEAQTLPWAEHTIGGTDKEVMFLTLADLDADGRRDVLAAVSGRELIYFRRKAGVPVAWQSLAIQLPAGTGTGKAVKVGDLNLDGRLDIVFTCEHAENKSGVMWLSYRNAPTDPVWNAHDISGPQGAKYDLVQLLDLDNDNDLDVITCEERTNLGVIWYENPTR